MNVAEEVGNTAAGQRYNVEELCICERDYSQKHFCVVGHYLGRLYARSFVVYFFPFWSVVIRAGGLYMEKYGKYSYTPVTTAHSYAA